MYKDVEETRKDGVMVPHVTKGWHLEMDDTNPKIINAKFKGTVKI